MKVKICGITNLEDALVAAEAGADYLGFIFYPPSPRAIEPEAARDIAAYIRQTMPNPPLMAGVFVNESAELIAQTLDETGLDLAQLSGEEVPALAGDPQSLIYGRAYKAIRPATAAEAEVEAEWYAVQSSVSSPHSLVPSLLVDTYHPTLRGGTGIEVDWGIVVHLFEHTPKVMLAGGLRPDNVAAAVRQLRPFAVDVASGVEAYPGKKDHDKVRAFIANAKRNGKTTSD
ncbi:MAG: phosphoribosylanthranilate isomerase [Chloroflexi bacterium]|nr:phosphoribosylanthranilate isomerase [Chloroflexota bacterium]